MAYTLGIWKNNSYYPLNLKKVNGNTWEHDITKIVAFTQKFVDEEALLKYLYDNNLIDSLAAEVVYITNENGQYQLINNNKNIYYAHTKDYFVENFLTSRIIDNLYNEDFQNNFLVHYLHVFSYPDKIKNILLQYIDKPVFFIKTFLQFTTDDKGLITLRDELISLINLYSNCTTEQEKIKLEKAITAQISFLVDRIFANSQTTLQLFAKMIPYLPQTTDNKQIALINLYYAINDANFEKIATIVATFIKHLLYGKRKYPDAENYFDLVSFVYNYDYYCYYQQKAKKVYQYIRENDEDYEEFLEPEDFTRINDDANNYGLLLNGTLRKNG